MCADQGNQSWPRTGLAVHRCSPLTQPLRGCLCLLTDICDSLLAIPVMPSMLKALHSDCPAKPHCQPPQGGFRSSTSAVCTRPSMRGTWPSFSHVLLPFSLPMALSAPEEHSVLSFLTAARYLLGNVLYMFLTVWMQWVET